MALAAGDVRWCANNTGNEGRDHLWGETICMTDGSLAEATREPATPEVQPFVVGTPALAMMDNIAYQSGRGNWVLHEDGDDPAWARTTTSGTACPTVRTTTSRRTAASAIATINDLVGDAEWTGGVFDASGKRFFVSVQHNMTGFGVILEIDGWK